MIKTLKDLIREQLKEHDVDVDESIDALDKCPVFLVAAGSAVFTLWRSYVKADEANDIVTSELYTPYETTGINGNKIKKFVNQLNAAIRLGRFETPMKDDPFLRYAVAVSGDEVRTNPEDAVLKLISAPAALLDLTTPAFTMLLVGRYTVKEAVTDAASAVKAINADNRYRKRLLSIKRK